MANESRMQLTVRDRVACLRLTRGEKRNAIDEAFLREFEACLKQVADDTSVSVVLLQAEGPSFCAGFDLDVLKQFADEHERKQRFAPIMRARLRAMSRVLDALAALEPVTVAMVQGAAAGGGFSLALACDFRIMSDDARCWFPEVALGSALSPASTRLLMRSVSGATAKDIILTCRRLDADALHRLGIAHRISAAARLEEETEAFIATLLAQPTNALLASKATIDALSAHGRVIRTDLLAERD